MRTPAIRVMRIASGPMGTWETLRVMVSLVKQAVSEPEIQALAYQLYEECDCYSCAECIIETIDTWTRKRYIYIKDADLWQKYTGDAEEVEVINTPLHDVQEIEETGNFKGDCDDVATFVAAIFKTLGFQTRFVAIRTRQDQNFSHVFVETLAANKWLIIDPTVPPGTIHKHFGRMVQYA